MNIKLHSGTMTGDVSSRIDVFMNLDQRYWIVHDQCGTDGCLDAPERIAESRTMHTESFFCRSTDRQVETCQWQNHIGRECAFGAN